MRYKNKVDSARRETDVLHVNGALNFNQGGEQFVLFWMSISKKKCLGNNNLTASQAVLESTVLKS